MEYPKPFMSISTLAEHLELSVRTVEEWVRIGKLPKPIERTPGGKRLWIWKDVVKAMEAMRAEKADEEREARMQAAVARMLERPR